MKIQTLKKEGTFNLKSVRMSDQVKDFDYKVEANLEHLKTLKYDKELNWFSPFINASLCVIKMY